MAAAALYRNDGAAAASNAFIAAVVAVTKAQDVEVWPENWKTFCLFDDMRTQWHVGMNGPTGLRYEALYPLLDRLCPTQEEWEYIFNDIRIMELEALSVMHEKD